MKISILRTINESGGVESIKCFQTEKEAKEEFRWMVNKRNTELITLEIKNKNDLMRFVHCISDPDALKKYIRTTQAVKDQLINKN